MIIPNATQPNATEFFEWFKKERDENRLVDIKFYLGNHAQSSSEEVFEEINSMLKAERLEDPEFF